MSNENPESSGEFRDEAGRFTKGNPGKPVGAISKSTRIRQEIIGLWDAGKMEEKLLRLMETDPKEAKAILQVVASLMPREDHLEVSTPEPLTIKIEKDTDEPERQHSPETDKP